LTRGTLLGFLSWEERGLLRCRPRGLGRDGTKLDQRRPGGWGCPPINFLFRGGGGVLAPRARKLPRSLRLRDRGDCLNDPGDVDNRRNPPVLVDEENRRVDDLLALP